MGRGRDPLGQAVLAYWQTGCSGVITVLSDGFSPDEIPVDYLFRSLEVMPDGERKALDHCQGRILEIGAGAGSHALELQRLGHGVVTVDNSPGAVQVQQMRGVQQAVCLDILDESNDALFQQAPKFDTVLLLMNGIGVTGSLKGLVAFLKRAKSWLRPGGQLLFDSSDVSYLFDVPPTMSCKEGTDYYGQLKYQMVYNKVFGQPFSWLFVDKDTIREIIKPHGYSFSVLHEGDHYDYLGCLRLEEASV